MCKIPNITEQQTMLRDAFKRLVDTHKQKNVIDTAGIGQTIASSIYHGRKGIGDDTIEKLDAAYPDWRNLPSKEKPKETLADKLNLGFIGVAEFKRQLNLFFDGMSAEHKEAIVLIANKLYDIDRPNDLTANPTNGKTKKEKEKQE
jgi:hypothetical protein